MPVKLEPLEENVTTLKSLVVALTCIGLGVVLIGVSSSFLKNSDATIAALATAIQTIGSTVLTIGLVQTLYDLYVRRDFLREIIQTVGAGVEKKIVNEFDTLKRLEHTGLFKVTDRLDTSELSQIFSSATTTIRIMQTWMPDLTTFEQSLVKGAKNGASVQILLVAPTEAHLSQRTKDLMRDDEAGKLYVMDNTQELKRIARHFGIVDKISLRYYRSLPPFALYGADNDVVVGLYWFRIQSVNGRCLHFKIAPDGEQSKSATAGEGANMGQYYVDNFESIWLHSTEIQLFDEPPKASNNQTH